MGKFYEGGYNYSRLTKAYQKFPTEKQLMLVEALKATCERVGVSTEGLFLSTETKRDTHKAIKSLYGVLQRNGYDGHGNPTKTYYMAEDEKPKIDCPWG